MAPDRITLFVDVILPLAVPNLYTYRVPVHLNEEIVVGQRAVVQFGKNKLYACIIRFIHENAPRKYTAKYIDSLLDQDPIVNERQLQHWEWISGYYMCHIGEVMLAALPASLKLASETNIVLHPDFNRNYDSLTDKELLIVEALEIQDVLSLKDVASIVEQKTTYSFIKSLLKKKAVLVEEELKERFQPRMASFVVLTEAADKEENMEDFFNQLARAPKQLEVLMAFIKLSGRYEQGNTKAVGKIKLQKAVGTNSSVIGELVKKGIFEIEEREVGRISSFATIPAAELELTDHQRTAFDGITKSFETKDVTLLHGITSSGKTEIYIELIKAQIAQQKQVLYLLPEIALTSQIINRLRIHFGDSVGIYHSRFSNNEKVEIWQKVAQAGTSDHRIILGARSALFLPFSDLGLIIIDEEHENAFKQYHPAPRYNARDAAMILAKQHHAKVLLGSATPAIETFHHAQSGMYGYVPLLKRYGGVLLPAIICADIGEERRKKKMTEYFSETLLNEMRAVLENGEQIILFQNRRGYTPLWSCQTCGWAPSCTRCDVTPTYHKQAHQLRCHYCGSQYKPPVKCEACGSSELKMLGFGTEKIEEDLALILPNAKVARMDLDTTRAKNSYYQIITEFEEHKIDILVGTQMVTKGLDFSNVALVGILNADAMLRFPDFRAFERSYQLMAQVAGRAGRSQKRGKVVIQTANPNHWIIQKVMQNDYEGMFSQELTERRNFHYPPFYRLLELTVQHRDADLVNVGAAMLADSLRAIFGNHVLGPEFPLIARIRNLYHKKILIKLDRKTSAGKAKELIRMKLDEFHAGEPGKKLRVIIDVDPL